MCEQWQHRHLKAPLLGVARVGARPPKLIGHVGHQHITSEWRDCNHGRAYVAITSPEKEPEAITSQRRGGARKDDVFPLSPVLATFVTSAERLVPGASTKPKARFLRQLV